MCLRLPVSAVLLLLLSRSRSGARVSSACLLSDSPVVVEDGCASFVSGPGGGKGRGIMDVVDKGSGQLSIGESDFVGVEVSCSELGSDGKEVEFDEVFFRGEFPLYQGL